MEPGTRRTPSPSVVALNGVTFDRLSASFCFRSQTLCALFRGVHQKNKSASGFDIINMLMGFDKAEQRMKVPSVVSGAWFFLVFFIFTVWLLSGQELMERLDSLLCGDGSESLKSLCLKLLLCLVTVRLKQLLCLNFLKKSCSSSAPDRSTAFLSDFNCYLGAPMHQPTL